MRALLLTSSACLFAAPMPALAQTPTQPPSETAESVAPDGSARDVVIVTAQRREEDLQKVAVAVDVLQGFELSSKGLTDLDGLGNLSPALTIQDTTSGNIIFLRGVGNFTLTANSDPAISFNYDGIYVGRPAATHGVFYDLDRVEVLKGPQGILYGRNATGGAINVIPTRPDLRGFSGNFTGSLGNYGIVQGQGAVNIPVTDNSALRIAGSYSKRDGYLEDGTDNDDTKALRVQYLAELTDDLTVRFAGDIAKIEGAGDNVSYSGLYRINLGTGRYEFTPSGLPLSEGMFTDRAQAYRRTLPAASSNTAGINSAGRNMDNLAPYPELDNVFWGLNAEVTYDSPIGTVSFIPAYRKARLDQTVVSGAFMTDTESTFVDASAELRLNGDRIGMIDYTTGVYWYWGDTGAGPNSDGSVNNASSLIIFPARDGTGLTTRSLAAFGSVTAHLTDRLRLTGGLRFTFDDKSTKGGPTLQFLIQCVNPAAGCPNAPLFTTVERPEDLPFTVPGPGGAPIPRNGALYVRATSSTAPNQQSTDRTTYRAAIEYDVAPDSMAYASYETGYRAGGFNSAVGFETYAPEYIYAYTAGMKNRLFDDRLLLNLELFHWEYTNQQVSAPALDLAGRVTNFTQNIGESTINGIDIQAVADVTDATTLNLDLQYLDAQNDSFTYFHANRAAGQPGPLTGCSSTLTSNPVLYRVDCSDKPGYNSPEWSINFGVQHRIELADGEIILGADTAYKSSRYIGFGYLPEQHLGADWVSNANISYVPNDNWRVTAFVRNIEDNRIPNFATINPVNNALVLGTSAPRTYGVTLSTEF